MEIILLQKINKLGNIGDTVEVKPGFGRNFLIPTGKALRATKENKQVFETTKAKLLEKNKDEIEKAEKIRAEVESLNLIIVRSASDTGILYGSVTTRDIANLIGENGIKLSGGQRQRIAIARALIKDAPLLIMDEATSSLDNITENKIHETINSLMNNKTKLIIAHRLSTIEDADIIYVLDKGKIESQGKHEELISKSTIYKKLQLREQLENEF